MTSKGNEYRIAVMDGVDYSAFRDQLMCHAGDLRVAADDKTSVSFGEGEQDMLAGLMRSYDCAVIRSKTRFRQALYDCGRISLIIRAGSGLDNIDLAVAQENNIEVRNTPAANSIAVAEVVQAMALSSGRRLFETVSKLQLYKGKNAHTAVKKGYNACGVEESSATVIGCGSIGKEVASRFLMAEMDLTLYDALMRADDVRRELDKHLRSKGWDYEYIYALETADSLEEAVEGRDLVTIHVPLTEYTKGMIVEKHIKLMNKGATLINTSRQGIVDEQDLYDNLDRIGMYFTDLNIIHEGLAAAAKDRHNHRIVQTPHICANTRQAQIKAAKMAADTVIEFLAQKKGL
ncbi:hypothetical protein GF351_06460 [Candidatus Woesearchaeota archaeon]|nr:hypothetical protein [Candidatus Woesearchaeota archaeon]